MEVGEYFTHEEIERISDKWKRKNGKIGGINKPPIIFVIPSDIFAKIPPKRWQCKKGDSCED